ncbi:MAG: hypothetical protein ACT6FB_04890 [Methanosarcinaceae archaeon]
MLKTRPKRFHQIRQIHFSKYQTQLPALEKCAFYECGDITIQPYLKPDVDGENPLICVHITTFVGF